MNDQETIDKYNLTKKAGICTLLQLILSTAALTISLVGVFTSLDLANNWNRLVVYGGQAVVCLATIVFGFNYFSKKDTKYFKTLILVYALLEAVRVSLLQTGSIPGICSYPAKFILVLLALSAALLSEKYEKKEGFYLSIVMVVLELLLYAVFIVGFPAVRANLLYMIFPLVGILITGSMCAFIAARLEPYRESKNTI